MYPVLKEGVSIGTFQYEGSDTIHYYVENADGKEFEISRNLWDALLQADGTQPLNLPDNGRRILPKLKKNGLVRTSRFVRGDGILNRFILFPIGSRSQDGSLFAKATNEILPILAILLFSVGIYYIISGRNNIGYDFNLWLYCGLLIGSLALHETGHLVAGLAYGYKIHDTGVLLLGIIPIGAYVAHEGKENATKAEKMQFALAGVEMNLLIAGICLISAVCYYPLSSTMVSVANINVVLACINLLPASGLDGEYALSALCEVNSISEVSKKWLTNKKRRQKLLQSGLPGFVCLGIFFITLISEVILRLLIGFDIICVFFNIF